MIKELQTAILNNLNLTNCELGSSQHDLVQSAVKDAVAKGVKKLSI